MRWLVSLRCITSKVARSGSVRCECSVRSCKQWVRQKILDFHRCHQFYIHMVWSTTACRFTVSSYWPADWCHHGSSETHQCHQWQEVLHTEWAYRQTDSVMCWCCRATREVLPGGAVTQGLATTTWKPRVPRDPVKPPRWQKNHQRKVPHYRPSNWKQTSLSTLTGAGNTVQAEPRTKRRVWVGLSFGFSAALSTGRKGSVLRWVSWSSKYSPPKSKDAYQRRSRFSSDPCSSQYIGPGVGLGVCQKVQQFNNFSSKDKDDNPDELVHFQPHSLKSRISAQQWHWTLKAKITIGTLCKVAIAIGPQRVRTLPLNSNVVTSIYICTAHLTQNTCISTPR